MERNWLEAMTHFVAEETAKFHSPGFSGYPTNWLQIYDNWKLVAALNEAAAMERLNRERVNATNPAHRQTCLNCGPSRTE
ncbi:MAG: hypothetical protein OXI87_17900 [Albidovulum sp.]|nr:hypothetical protein [Albidovulum sp.]